MSRFSFAYETLLRVRRCEEHVQQHIVASLEAQRLGLESKLRQQEEFLDTNQTIPQAARLGMVDSDGLRLHGRLAVQAMRRSDVMNQHIAASERRLLAAREVLVERMRARRAVELLRERMLNRWELEQQRCELRHEDDGVMIRTAWHGVVV